MLQKKHGFNLTNSTILDEFGESEIDDEMKALISLINVELS
jgi:hypothetical protein